MAVQRFFDGALYAPDVLEALNQAFDQSWQSIEGNFGNTPHVVNAARLRLAQAILSVVTEGSRDVEALKNAALREMVNEFGQLVMFRAESRSK